MLVRNVKYYTTDLREQKVNDTIMRIIDKKNDPSFLTKLLFGFRSNGYIEGHKKEDAIYFYRPNKEWGGGDFLFVVYKFNTFKINDKLVLKITSTLNPIGLLACAILFSFPFSGILKELGLIDSGANLKAYSLMFIFMYGTLFIAYKMNRDSTIEDIVKLLNLKKVNLRKLKQYTR